MYLNALIIRVGEIIKKSLKVKFMIIFIKGGLYFKIKLFHIFILKIHMWGKG